jgi:ABC-type transport system involved in multi-copper enzyme maturation permease subunit
MPIFLRWLLRLGPINPIAVRLVQNGSRRSRHLYIRATYLAVLIVVLLWSLLLTTTTAPGYRELAAGGAQSFTWIAYLQVLLICILAPVFMGGAIAQEANPRTWEVLLTTPMTATEIVLGNLFGRLFFVLALLAASLPLFALTQYFGGVPYQAVFASYLVAGCAALLVGAIAISLSVSRLVGKRAFFVFYVAVVSYLAVTLAVDFGLRQAKRGAAGGDGVTFMTALNPFLALNALVNPSTYPRAPEGSTTGISRWFLEIPVTTWCVGSTFLSFLFMFLSTFTVRLGGLSMLGSESSGVPWYRRLLGGSKGGEHRAPKTVGRNPIAWREAASRNSTPSKIAARWAFYLSGMGWGFFLVYMLHTGSFSTTTFQQSLAATLWAELVVIALVAVNTAATAISKEREDGTLDLLLTTPLTASAYIWGKLRGLVAYLLPLIAVPILTLGMAAVYALGRGFGNPGAAEVPMMAGLPAGGGGGAIKMVPIVLPESALVAPLVFVPFMAFCVMIGLQWSVKSKGTLASVVGTVGVVGAVGAVVGLCSWNATQSIALVGPMLAGLSPAAFIQATIFPEAAMSSTISTNGVLTARFSLMFGSLIAAGVYAAICYGIHSNMVRTFDMTVRKLAGTR